MLSVGAICFEDRFYTSKKGGIGEGGQTQAQQAVHMAAVLVRCRKALVGIGSAISLLFSTNGRRNRSCLCRGSISGTVGSFQSEEAFAGRTALL